VCVSCMIAGSMHERTNTNWFVSAGGVVRPSLAHNQLIVILWPVFNAGINHADSRHPDSSASPPYQKTKKEMPACSLAIFNLVFLVTSLAAGL